MLGIGPAMIGTLLAIPRRLLGALDDIRRVALDLDEIRQSAASLDEEVRLMRQGVERLSVQVDELRGDFQRLRLPRRRALLNGRADSMPPVEAPRVEASE